MSLYDNASLVMIPSGVKEDKLYSIKPTDGSGDFTFSRGSDIQSTRVNSNGFVEKAKVNLLTYSNTFSNAAWTFGGTLTGGQSGYDGSSDAWLLDKTGASQNINQAITLSGVQTFSIYAKAGSVDWIRLLYVDGTGQNRQDFDLANGVLGTSGTNNIDADIVSVGGGWYRVSVTANASTTTLRIYPMTTDNDTTGTSGSIYIQDAALCHGLIAQDYIETTTTAVVEGLTADLPRLDYSGGASCPSLLLEPSRTNTQAYSEYFNSSIYNNSAAIITDNDATSPEGVQNATKFEGDGTDGNVRLWDNLTFPSSGDWTFSVFAKAGTNDFLRLNIGGVDGAQNGFFDLRNGTTPQSWATIEPVGSDGWYRISITSDLTGPDLTGNINFYLAYSIDASFFPTAGDANGQYVHIYGAQLEAGSYPTSYIPTYGAAANRGADDMDTTFSSPFATNGSATFFIELKGAPISASNSNTRNFSLDFASGDYITYNHGSTSAHRLKVEASGTAYYSTSGISNVLQDEDVKMAAAVTPTSVVMYVNGQEAVNTSLVGDWDSATLLRTAIQDLIGIVPVKQFIFFPTALTNAELAALTTI